MTKTIECKRCGIHKDIPMYRDYEYCSSNCYYDSIRKTHKDYVTELQRAHNGTIITIGEYKGTNHNIECKCMVCGNIMNKEARKYIEPNNNGCSVCSSKSVGETLIASWLDSSGIRYRREQTFDDLIHIGKLRYDFAIIDKYDKVVMLIEYDGIHHYEPVEFFGGINGYRDVVLRDKIKNDYANDNGYVLHRIGYMDRNNIDSILERMI